MSLNEYIEQTTGYSDTIVASTIEAFRKYLELCLRKGEEVQITNLGTFGFKDLPEREARNPRTQETVIAPPKRKPTFKFSNNFIDKIQDGLNGSATAETAKETANSAELPPPVPPKFTETVAEKGVPDRIWYVHEGGNQKPLKEGELIGSVGANTPVWSNGITKEWKLAGSVPELSYLFEDK